MTKPRAQILVSFGKRLRELRRERGLSQAMLAERAEITSEHVSRIERALVGPSLEVMERLAGALDVEIKALFEFATPRAGADATVLQLQDIARRGSADDRRLLLRVADTIMKYRAKR